MSELCSDESSVAYGLCASVPSSLLCVCMRMPCAESAQVIDHEELAVWGREEALWGRKEVFGWATLLEVFFMPASCRAQS